MLFCDYCKIFKNNYFEENLQTAAYTPTYEQAYERSCIFTILLIKKKILSRQIS